MYIYPYHNTAVFGKHWSWHLLLALPSQNTGISPCAAKASGSWKHRVAAGLDPEPKFWLRNSMNETRSDAVNPVPAWRTPARSCTSCHPQRHSMAHSSLRPDRLPSPMLSATPPALDRGSPSPPTGPVRLLAKGRDMPAAAPGQSQGVPRLHPNTRARSGRCHRNCRRLGQAHTGAARPYSPSPQLSAAHRSLNLRGYISAAEQPGWICCLGVSADPSAPASFSPAQYPTTDISTA